MVVPKNRPLQYPSSKFRHPTHDLPVLQVYWCCIALSHHCAHRQSDTLQSLGVTMVRQLTFSVILLLWLLWFRCFHFRFGRFLAKNCSIGLSGFRFFTQKMSTALHRTIVETDQPITLRRTIHQMDNIVMFIYKLAVYVMHYCTLIHR